MVFLSVFHRLEVFQNRKLKDKGVGSLESDLHDRFEKVTQLIQLPSLSRVIIIEPTS